MRTMSCRHAQLVRPLWRKPEMPMNGRNWPVSDGSRLTVCFEEAEHVSEPDARPTVGKAVPLLGRATVRGIDLNLRRFVRRRHRGVQGSTWRKAVVVLGLKKEDRRLRVLDRMQQATLEAWSLLPALRSAGRVNRRAVASLFRTEHRLDTTERIAHGGDQLGTYKRLLFEPS